MPYSFSFDDPAAAKKYIEVREGILNDPYIKSSNPDFYERISNSKTLEDYLKLRDPMLQGVNLGELSLVNPKYDEINKFLNILHENTHGLVNQIGIAPSEKLILDKPWKFALQQSGVDPAKITDEALATQRELRHFLGDETGNVIYTPADSERIYKALEKLIETGHPYIKNPADIDMRALINSLNKIGLGATVPVGLMMGAEAIQNSQPQQQAYGGYTNPYMYYSGGPMYYGNGGKAWKHIGAGAYALGEGMLDTLTMGATDQLTDKGYYALQKAGNKNLDLNDPEVQKYIKTQDQIKGYGNTAAAITTAAFTGQVGSAVNQSAKGLNTAFQASDWATDDFKKWSNIGSQAIGIGAGFVGGSLDSAQSVSKLGESAAKFGAKASKYAPYANQAVGMFGRSNNNQTLLQQVQEREEYLNSPEYLAMKEKQNQEYVNRGLSFSNGGNINNNSLNLQNYTMRNRYNSYRKKSKGGTFHQYGINQIPDSAGLHHQNAYGGVPIGPDAMAEGGEYVLDGNYVVSDQVDGMNTQTDEFGNTMAENLKTRLNKYTLRDLDSKNKGQLRRPNDSIAQNTIDQIKQQAIMET
jgi:hypothetical protein